MKPKTKTVLLVVMTVLAVGFLSLLGLGFLCYQLVKTPEKPQLLQEWDILANARYQAGQCVFDQLEKGTKDPYIREPSGALRDDEDPSIIHTAGYVVYFPDGEYKTKWFEASFRVKKGLFGNNWKILECSVRDSRW